MSGLPSSSIAPGAGTMVRSKSSAKSVMQLCVPSAAERIGRYFPRASP